MDKKEQRLNYIIEHLKKNNAASIRELSELCNVTMMTIRRDLEILKERNIIKFFHGGAVYNPDYKENPEQHIDYLIQKQKMLHKEEKLAIAKSAAALISENETIMLDSGTTIFYLSKEIPNEFSLTTICWSLNIIEVLTKKQKCNMIASGGIYHHETQMFESLQGLDLVKNTRASKAFISAGGVHKDLGVTCPFPYEAETKRAAIKSSMTNILLVDSSKFNKVCTGHLGDITDFDIVITDHNISDEYREFLLEKGVSLIIAEDPK